MTDYEPHSQSSSVKPRLFYGYIMVAAGFLIMAIVIGAYLSFGVFFKPMLTDFGWTRATTSAAVSLSWIIGGPLAILIGGLNDRFGPRRVITGCCLLAASGYLLLSQISSLWQLYLFYGVLIGISSTIFVPLASTIARWFVHRRTLMTGLVVCGVGIGSWVMPPISEQLIQSYGWRTSFVIIGIGIMVIASLISQLLKSDPGQVGQLAFLEKSKTARDMHIVTRSFSLKEALSTWQLWVIFAMMFCYGYCAITIQIHLVPYATDMGIPSDTAAGILGIIGGASVIGRIAFGIVGDRIGNKNAFITGFSLMLLCLVWLLYSREVWGLYLFAVFFGIAYGDCAVQQSPLVATLFGLKSLGLIFGFITLGFPIGATVGPFISGYIFDVTNSYHLAFLICTILCACGLILNILLKMPDNKGTDKR